MNWTLYPANRLQAEHEGVWQAVNEFCCASHPLLDKKFVVPLVEVFGHDREQLAILHDGGRAIGAALLERKKAGTWELFLPEQAPIGPLILNADNVEERLSNLSSTLPGQVLLLSLPKQDPAYFALDGLDCSEQLKYGTTIKIDVRGTFADYWKARHKNIRRNVKRLYAKLEQLHITPTLLQRDAKHDMAEAVVEHGMLETSGWKHRTGTAVSADNRQGAFYVDVLENFAAHNGARVYQLVIGEKVVASQLGIVQNGMLVLLKTAYDESLSAFAPGRILDHMMIRHIFEQGDIRTIEYYTSASKEDCKWCTDQREIYHVNYFQSHMVRRLASTSRKLKNLCSGAGRTKKRRTKRVSTVRPAPPDVADPAEPRCTAATLSADSTSRETHRGG